SLRISTRMRVVSDLSPFFFFAAIHQKHSTRLPRQTCAQHPASCASCGALRWADNFLSESPLAPYDPHRQTPCLHPDKYWVREARAVVASGALIQGGAGGGSFQTHPRSVLALQSVAETGSVFCTAAPTLGGTGLSNSRVEIGRTRR